MWVTSRRHLDHDLPRSTDWSDVDYVLVGTDVKLIGVLCVADVFGRLNDFAEAFVLIYEIEHEVRDLIAEITGDAGLPPLIANMRLPENTPPLRAATDCARRWTYGCSG